MNSLRNFGFLLKDVSRLYVRRFEDRARSLALTLPQCKVLVYLARCEGISQAQLAEQTEIEPMTLVRILDHMEAEGWLERRAAPADRRARSLYLMPKAKPLVESIWAVSDATRGEAFGEIPEDQAVLFTRLLEEIRTNIVNLDPVAASLPGSTPLAPTARARLGMSAKRRNGRSVKS
jgi:DNA-binding MarR family transcriptional regulator